MLALDQREQHIGITVRTAAGRLRLRSPTFLIAVPHSTPAGTSVQHELWIGSGRAVVRATAGGAMDSVEFRYGAQHGWALINPFARAHDNPDAWNRWTMAWLLGWGTLVGLATMWQRHPAAWLGVALLALLVISARFGATTSVPELASFAVGWAVVLATGSWFRRPPVEA